jgi:UDP-N-acetylglucosamine 1-carboxyvinyltransferase
MDKLQIVQGGKRLNGDIAISGAKNAALPILCAGLLTAGDVELSNVPRLHDVRTMLKLLGQTGLKVTAGRRERHAERRAITAGSAVRAGEDHARLDPGAGPPAGALRRSQGLAAGRLRDRFASGRPAHQGPAAMGAEITIEGGYIYAKCPKLKGARIVTDMITVTGTENLLMAATLAEGETVLENAAREPEVTDLANLLVAMGAKIEGIGTDRLVIQGVAALHGARHAVISDRIEAATFLCAVAATGGDIRITQHPHRHLRRRAGQAARDRPAADIGGNWIRARMDGAPAAGVLPHHRIPGLPDRHAGPVHGGEHHRRRPSRVTETIFENRFMHVQEMNRLGARSRPRAIPPSSRASSAWWARR